MSSDIDLGLYKCPTKAGVSATSFGHISTTRAFPLKFCYFTLGLCLLLKFASLCSVAYPLFWCKRLGQFVTVDIFHCIDSQIRIKYKNDVANKRNPNPNTSLLHNEQRKRKVCTTILHYNRWGAGKRERETADERWWHRELLVFYLDQSIFVSITTETHCRQSFWNSIFLVI